MDLNYKTIDGKPVDDGDMSPVSSLKVKNFEEMCYSLPKDLEYINQWCEDQIVLL